MNSDKSEKINLVSHARSHSGLRIVHENINRRTTDIFNSKGDYISFTPAKYKIVNNRAIEMNNKLIDDNIRSKSPYIGGHKNTNYIPKNLMTSDDLLSITNPFGKNKNYREILTDIKAFNEKKEENDSIDFFKPDYAFNSTKVKKKTYNKGAANRSYFGPNLNSINDDDSPLNRSAIVLGISNPIKDHHKSNSIHTQNTTFDFNEKCKSKCENTIKGKLKRHQYYTENATLALMLLNKPKQYTIPEVSKSETEPIKKAKNEEYCNTYQLTSFDLHEKSKDFVHSQIKEKVQQRKNMIENISNALLSQRKAEKEILSNKFQTLNNSFNMNNARDHVRERYEKNYDNKNNNSNNLKPNTYYEQIKAFNSKHYEFDNEVTQINLDTPFRNHKKINEILHETKNINQILDNTKMLNSRTVRKCTLPANEYKRISARENEKTAWK